MVSPWEKWWLHGTVYWLFKKLSSIAKSTNLSDTHYSLISAIWHLHPLLSISVKFQHVKGYQDESQIMLSHALHG